VIRVRIRRIIRYHSYQFSQWSNLFMKSHGHKLSWISSRLCIERRY